MLLLHQPLPSATQQAAAVRQEPLGNTQPLARLPRRQPTHLRRVDELLTLVGGGMPWGMTR